MNRDEQERFWQQAKDLGIEMEWDSDGTGDDGNPTGTPEAELHWRVDVSSVIDRKRAALAAHASQGDARFFLTLPEQAFAAFASFEYYREDGRPAGMVEGWPF